MDLSPAEEALISLVRLAALGDLSLSVTRASGAFVVVVSSPEENGITMGIGPTFEAAVFSLIGAEPPSTGEEAEAAPRPALRIVGGSHDEIARAGSAGEVQPAVTEHRQRAPGPFSRVSPQQRPAGFQTLGGAPISIGER